MDNKSQALRKLKLVIGRAERVDFPDAGIFGVHAKIDTGAYRSSVWASDIREENGTLRFRLLGPSAAQYSGQDCETTEYARVEVENSFGQKEERYSIYLRVKVGAKTTKTTFTLANRGVKTYPVLIGRKLLRGRYIVDVSEGEPLTDEEAEDL
ncbi:MAG TPA: RimK/LysX family protein [Candidatus Saccharimonadales bacterium]|nr:RimK/LysX family protein [Candidatus Saccharimonadales bacterium]